mmetsp:Transcript_30745/g.68113  ORF Transcript_30745/g.68113 Transcript_30745/m.68113 type:complete len:126 (+) Transcript_30745:4665-5042(+)
MCPRTRDRCAQAMMPNDEFSAPAAAPREQREKGKGEQQSSDKRHGPASGPTTTHQAGNSNRSTDQQTTQRVPQTEINNRVAFPTVSIREHDPELSSGQLAFLSLNLVWRSSVPVSIDIVRGKPVN